MTVISGDGVPGKISVQCDFIPGSDAQGCMVVLVGESDNTTVNLTRSGTLLTACAENMHIVSSLIEVFGYDIEFDGSVGIQQVPGTSVMTTSSDSYSLCQSHTPNTENSLSEYNYIHTIEFQYVSMYMN